MNGDKALKGPLLLGGLNSGLMALLFVGVLGLFVLSVSIGSVSIPFSDVIRILWGEVPSKSSWFHIVLTLRLPRAITGILAGAALAVSGLQMQTLFRNPLAGPFVLGISSGASLGVALIVLGFGAGASTFLTDMGVLGNFGIVFSASLGAGTVVALVLLVARRIDNSMTLLILGLMFGYASGALVSVLMYFSIAERIQAFMIWSFGSFGGVTWQQMWAFASTILFGLFVAFLSVKPLNALLLGETYARSLGLTVQRARFWILISASILAGTTTAFCGPIAFLGVAVPHIARSLFNTSDHRVLVPATVLIGAMLALFADLIARLPGSQQALPLNAVTALIGTPIVTWIILRRRNLKSSFAS